MKNKAHILLVEDNQMDIELTLDAFREVESGNSAYPCHSGQEALDYLFGRGDYSDRKKFPLPGLILLDLKMPGVDGFEVLKHIKSTPVLKRIPVVILTSSREEEDRAQTYDAGANSYLVKPVSFEGFLGVVRQIEEYWVRLNAAPPGVSI